VDKSGGVILAIKPLIHFLPGMKNGDSPNIPILFYKIIDLRKLILWEIQEEYIRTRFKAQCQSSLIIAIYYPVVSLQKQ